MKFQVRPELPTTVVDNDALLTRPSSTYKSGNVVQTNGATSLTHFILFVVIGEAAGEAIAIFLKGDGHFNLLFRGLIRCACKSSVKRR